MNRTLLLKVKEQILKEPARFIMSAWIAKRASLVVNDAGANHYVGFCGTAGCIAGWTCMLAEEDEQFTEDISNMIGWGDYATAATELLGLSRYSAAKLFAVGLWPSDLENRWFATHNLKERANIAAEMIDRVIAEQCPKGAENEQNVTA